MVPSSLDRATALPSRNQAIEGLEKWSEAARNDKMSADSEDEAAWDETNWHRSTASLDARR